MVDLVTMRDGHSLVPATAFDVAQLDKLRSGQPLFTKVTFRRSVEHMRWYRSFLSVVADGIGVHPDSLHADLKFKCGLIRRILLGQIGPIVELESCAFATMDEVRFKEFTSMAVEVVFRDYLAGVRRRDVLNRVNELVGDSKPWRASKTSRDNSSAE